MAIIDIGGGATNRAAAQPFGSTFVDGNNTANATGTLTSCQIWFNTAGSGVKIGTFYGTPPNFTSRDVETIGNVTAGSAQEFTGLSIDVQVGDYLGIYWSGGNIEYDTSGYSGVWYKAGDQFGAGSQAYSALAGDGLSIYAEGPLGNLAGRVMIFG